MPHLPPAKPRIPNTKPLIACHVEGTTINTNTHPEPDWDPRAASTLSDQRRAYDVMRERCPVAYDDLLGWSVFRHADIVGVLEDPDSYANASPYRAVPNGMDPPEHTHYRQMIEPYFGPGQILAFEPRCRRIAADLAQALPGDRHVELIAEFAQPFSFTALCAFVGWPSQDWMRLRDWANRNQQAAFSPDTATGATLAGEFGEYVAETLRARRNSEQQSGKDILTAMTATLPDAAALSDTDITSLLRNWAASHATVTAGIGIVVCYLAAHLDLQQQLRREPTLVPAAIEEILRTDGMLIANRRVTTREVHLNDRTIPAGEHVSLIWVAANRDGNTFDDPDTVRLDRDQAENLLFGAGIHNCVGATLARLEMRAAVEELLKHTSTITLDVDTPPTRAAYPSNGFNAISIHIR